MFSIAGEIRQDLRYALRQFFTHRSFTFVAVLSLASGIAATTAVFSVVWAVLIEPFPYTAPDRMVHFAIGSVSGSGYDGMPITATQWQHLRQVSCIEDSVLTGYRQLTITGDDLPEDVRGSQMTSNAFNFFGVPALLGRGLVPSDAPPGQDPQPVVVISYKFWQRRFNGDPSIVGRSVQLVHKSYQVVGVAAKRFTWNDADVYLPLKLTAGPQAYNVEARLRPGVTRSAAAQQVQPLANEFIKQNPTVFPPKPGPLTVIGINDMFLQALGPTLALLFGAVLLLLAVGCGNVSILLLARGAAREHEFAIRAAIGASRSRIVRQLLAEALLLSVTGAVLGVLLAYRLLAVIVALLPEYSFPHEAAMQINLPVLIFSAAVALLTGILFGLWPALRLSQPDLRETIQYGRRTASGSRGERSLHNALIAGQIGLTLLLLSTAGAAIQSFLTLAHTRLGYDPHHVMPLGLPLRESAYRTLAARAAHVEVLLDKIAQTPGVQMAAISANATPPANGFESRLDILGQPGSEDRSARVNFVSQDYFPLLRVPVRQGRLWSEAENHNAAPLIVINEALARKYFPKGDALGHSLQMELLKTPPPFTSPSPQAGGWLQIVGVTGDKLNDGLRNPVRPEVFVPYTLLMWPYTQALVRTDGSPLALVHTIGRQIAAVDSDQQMSGERLDLETSISRLPEYAQGQLLSWLFAGFSALALLLAGVGLYSVVSYTVAQRRGEFGIRMALGAPRGNVLELVMRSTAASIGGGVILGLLFTLLSQKVIAHFASATAPGSTQGYAPLAAAVVVLAAVALVAAGIPARRATLIAPMEAIRCDP